MKILHWVLFVFLIVNISSVLFILIQQNERAAKWDDTFYENGLWLYPEHPVVSDAFITRQIKGFVQEINSNNSFVLNLLDSDTTSGSNQIEMLIKFNEVSVFASPSEELVQSRIKDLSQDINSGFVVADIREIVITQLRTPVDNFSLDQLQGKYVQLVERVNLKTFESFISEVNILSL